MRMTRGFWELEGSSNVQLQESLLALLASGCRTEARIVAHLAEIDARRLYAKEACESLFAYCVKRLRLSENEAFHRIAAARVARRFPVVFGMLERRELHLTAVCLLRDHLTEANHAELLSEAQGKTKFQVQELVARRFPRAEVPSSVRRLPERVARRGVPRLTSATIADSETSAEPNNDASPPTPPIQRASVTPTSEARYRVQLNASAALKNKLDLARDLLSHANPDGDLALVVERALDALIEKLQKKRFAATARPAVKTHWESAAVLSKRVRRHIAAKTKRTVAERDGLRCTFVSDSGERCEARAFLQIHHEEPWARGGADDERNLRLLCATHNQLHARADFGDEFVMMRMLGRI